MSDLIQQKLAKEGREGEEHGLQLAAMGLEAEFSLVVDNRPETPEHVFKEPAQLAKGHLGKRSGNSVQLVTGSALYFDSGVIELATPVIEIDQYSSYRAGRALWESIEYLRSELDIWEEETGREARLVGFSTHYNVSFTMGGPERREGRTVERLAFLLTHILPFPVMLLAANKQSTGIGVRPRGSRIEVTADFTPDPAQMIATASFIVGVIRAVMQWRTFELEELDKRGLLVVEGFQPQKHSSRKGWVARPECFTANPFTEPVDIPLWTMKGMSECKSSQQIALCVWNYFEKHIEAHADESSAGIIAKVIERRQKTLLDYDRPEDYEDVGRRRWGRTGKIGRSIYEQLVHDALAGKEMEIGADRFKAMGVKGWSRVRLQRVRDGARFVASLDYLRRHGRML